MRKSTLQLIRLLCLTSSILCFGILQGQDNCASAVNIPVGVAVGTCNNVMGDNTGATASGDGAPSCGNFATGEDNWFSLTVPASGDLNIVGSTAGGPTDWAMSLYSGVCGGLTQIECDDDDGPGLFPELNITGRTPGETVYLQVWEWGNNSQGPFNICANDNTAPPAIPNDDCMNATALTVGADMMCTSIVGTNQMASASGETPAPSCGNFATGEDVWFSLQVPMDIGSLSVELGSAGGPTDWAISLYSGSCGSLTEIECDDDDGPGLFPLITRSDLTAGETVYVRVWEWGNNAEGAFNICAYSTPPPDVSLSKTAQHIDSNNNGTVEYGEEVIFTMVVSNEAGAGDATGVVVNSPIDPDSDLVIGSVTTTQGSVTSVNPNVNVDVGTLTSGSSVTITYNVEVTFASSGGSLDCQATASGDNFADVLSDDPGLPGDSDPTSIAIPTLGQWGILILGMILLIIGVVKITYSRKEISHS